MLWLIVILAGVLRLFRIDVLMRFIWDEGRDMLAIRNIIVNQDITLFGPFNEIGGHIDFFGVFHYYLMLPALWLSNFDPIGPAVFTALLGVCAVALTYYWVRTWESKNFALAVSLLMACSPLVVRFTQWPWNPNTTGFFGVLYLITLHWWQKKPTLLLAGCAGLLLGLLFQLHYFTIALGMAGLIVVVWQRGSSLHKKLLHSSIFTASALLPNLSFVLFDITHAGFYRTILFESLSGSSSQRFLSLNPLNFVTEPAHYLWEVSTQFWGNSVLGGVMSVVFIVWGGTHLSRSWRSKQATPQSQLILSWIGFLFIISFFPTLSDTYHSAPLWIALAIAGTEIITLTQLKTSLRQRKILLGCIALWLIFQNHIFRPPTWQENMPRLRSIGQAIASDALSLKNEKINFASFVDPDTRGTRFRYFTTLHDLELEHHDRYPQSTVLYIVTPHDWKTTRTNPAWELDTFRDATTSATIWSDTEWMVLRVQQP